MYHDHEMAGRVASPVMIDVPQRGRWLTHSAVDRGGGRTHTAATKIKPAC